MSKHPNLTLILVCLAATVLVFSCVWIVSPIVTTTPFTAQFNPGAVVAQGVEVGQYTAYTNPDKQGHDLVAVDIFMGLYKGAYADITVEVFHNGQVIARFAQDRYSDSVDNERFITLPSSVRIYHNETIIVRALNHYVAGVLSPMAPTVTLYFSN